MFSLRRIVALGALALVVGAGAAQAADMYTPGPGGYKGAPQLRPSVPAHSRGRWYGRLDFSYATFDEPTLITNGTALTNRDMGSAWGIGVGLGRYLTSNIRGELTYEYRGGSDIEGTPGAGACLPCGSADLGFSMTSHLLLANLYYDFKNSTRFTPYIGFGIGAALNQTENADFTTGCGCAGEIEGRDKWSFAAAFMAGVSIDVFGGRGHTRMTGSYKDPVYIAPTRSRMHLDVGYRYLYLGDAATGQVLVNGTTEANGISVDDIHAHEFRIGLRYDFN